MVLTMENRASVASEVMAHRHELAHYATNQTYQSIFWQLRYGDNGRVTCLNDNLKNIEVIGLAIRNNSPMILDTHVHWLRDTYTKLGLCTTFLGQSLVYMQDGAREILPEADAQVFVDEINRARKALGYQKPLCRELIKHQDSIAESVVDTMYRNTPYWSIRFGAAGRQSCIIDTYYNIAFMADAIEIDNHKGIQIHTRWMRDFLVSRGMCSRYYLEAWYELTRAILSVLPADYHEAIKNTYQIVAEAIRSEHPFSHLVEAQQDQLAEAAAQAHYDRQPALQQRLPRASYKRDIAYKFSYLSDAVRHDDPAIFENYVEWLQQSLMQLNMSQQDLDTSLTVMQAVLPPQAPDAVKNWLQPTGQAAGLQRDPSHALVAPLAAMLTQRLFADGTFWNHLQRVKRQQLHGTIQTSVEHLLQGLQQGDIQPVLEWLMQQTQSLGGSRAFLLDYVHQLRQAANETLPANLIQSLQAQLDQAMHQLTEDDPALALLQIDNLTEPIVTDLQTYSPYWQMNYERRSREVITNDIRALISLLADDLMELTDHGFVTAADLQRHYLLSQGICTAYYQQMMDFTLDHLQQVLDSETISRTTILIDDANAAMESSNAHVIALAGVQDSVVTFVIEHLQKANPAWVDQYPDGWESARTDLYYWLAYLTDAMTLHQPDLLASHVDWLHHYGRERGGSGDNIRLSLVALGHSIKVSLPDHAVPILTVMQTALSKIS